MKIGDNKMKYEELIEKRNKLAEELKNLDQEIKKQEKMKSQNIVADIIEKLEELKSYNPFAVFPMEAYCEECQGHMDTSVDFDDLMQLFQDYKESL